MDKIDNISFKIMLLTGSLSLLSQVALAVDYPVRNISSEAVIDDNATAKNPSGAVYSYRLDNSITGDVQCPGPSLPSNNAWHAVTILLPKSSETGRYTVNENVSIGIRLPVKFPETERWINYASNTCASSEAGRIMKASLLGNAFPMYIDFYVNKVTADGFISVPPMQLGSYERVFSDSPTGPAYPIGVVNTIPVRIKRLEIQLPGACTITPQSISLDHGVIAARKNSVAQETIGILCNRDVSIEFKLSAVNGIISSARHLQLPLSASDSNHQVASELYLSDLSGADLGYLHTFSARQNESRQFQIKSSISAENNTSSGQFSGSAWLVAYIQ